MSGRYPGVALDPTKRLSGTAPPIAVLRVRRDQVMSHKWLAPNGETQRPVTHGHDLEILKILWSATCTRETSFGSMTSILMGARCGIPPEPNARGPGHSAERKAAGTVTRELDEEDLILLCEVYRLDTDLLMGAPPSIKEEYLIIK